MYFFIFIVCLNTITSMINTNLFSILLILKHAGPDVDDRHPGHQCARRQLGVGYPVQYVYVDGVWVRQHHQTQSGQNSVQREQRRPGRHRDRGGRGRVEWQQPTHYVGGQSVYVEDRGDRGKTVRVDSDDQWGQWVLHRHWVGG